MLVERELHPFGLELTTSGRRLDWRSLAAELAPRVDQAGVVVLRGFSLNDQGQVQLLEALGRPVTTPGEPTLEHALLLNPVSNVGRKRPPRSVFHSDSSYLPTPPSYTVLRSIAVPAVGGATEFVNLQSAFDRLSTALQNRLRGIEVLHRVSGVADPSSGATESWHPMVRRHPRTHREGLFLSTPQRCIALRSVRGAEPIALLRALYEKITAPSQRLSHAWATGDVVLWDNRSTLHRANHEAVSGPRVLHRGMCAGETPIPACPPASQGVQHETPRSHFWRHRYDGGNI